VKVAFAALVLALPALANGQGDEWSGGFRMEGDPMIETVFGDSAQFKKYVDRFYTVHADMQRSREAFSRNVQATLAALSANVTPTGARTGKCPVEAVALPYTRAWRFGEDYHRLGKDLEAHAASIRDLDRLGETAGLTPDYRWKVSRSLKLFPQVLRDFREMRVAFQDQLAGEVRLHGCEPGLLVARGDELEKLNPPATGPVMAQVKPIVGKKKPGEKDAIPSAPATTATFFVDNSLCGGAVKVHVDGTMIGDVSGRAKSAFQTLSGRHDLCLITAGTTANCGDAGTVRRTFIHDGWSIQLRCD
jgi:hypothetical protein